MTDRLQGKVALVTGGSRGIGRGIAQRLAQDGCDTVAITYRTDRASVDDTAHRLEELGAKAVVLQSTLEEPVSIPGLFDVLDQELERVAGARGIDILVNVAGLGAQESLESMDQDTYDKIMAINARAPFFVTQAAATRLRDGGRVVNISSVYSRRPAVSNPVYSMAKAALNVLTEVMAAHLGPRGITVNTVAPSWTATEANAPAREAATDYVAGFAQGNVAHRMAEPADVAGVVAMLVGDDGAWLTGQYVDADGRWPTD